MRPDVRFIRIVALSVFALAAVNGAVAGRAGEPDDSLVEGGAVMVPFDLAVRQIVPDGVTINIAPAVDRNRLVNWRGGRHWTEVLRRTSTAVGNGVDITADGKRVWIYGPGGPVVASGDNGPASIQPQSISTSGPSENVKISDVSPAATIPGDPTAGDVSALPHAVIPVTAAPVDTASLPPPGTPRCPALPIRSAGDPPLAPAAEAAVDPTVPHLWRMVAGVSLQETLADMTRQVGLDFDNELGPVTVEHGGSCWGPYEDAVAYFVSGFTLANPRPMAIQTPNVLRLVGRANEFEARR